MSINNDSINSNSFALSCKNQRIQRSQFFFYEAGSNVRFEISSPYIKDSSGNLIYTPTDLDMRRKAEILKYIKPNNNNVRKNKFSQLALLSNKNKNRIICPQDNRPKPTSSSDVPGKIINLYEDPNIPLYKYYPISQQFNFQNIKYDDFTRLMDKFPKYNIVTPNNECGEFATIIILNPDSNEFTFGFNIPISLTFSCDYNTLTYTSTGSDVKGQDPSGNNIFLPQGEPYKLVNANLSIINATLDVYYSTTLIKSINAIYKSDPEDEKNLNRSLLTASIDFVNSTSGASSVKTYVGNLYFPDFNLQTVSQYVYTYKLTVGIAYSEFTNIEVISTLEDSVFAYRTNTDGENISNDDAKNIQNARYGIIINPENKNIYTSNNTNAVVEMFNPESEFITPAYMPINIETTSLNVTSSGGGSSGGGSGGGGGSGY